jgi:tyrosinase
MEGKIQYDKRTLIKTEINLAERLVYILQSYNSFSQVSENKLEDTDRGEGQDESFVKGRGFGSLEDIHNTLHTYTGGTGDYVGHMRRPKYAAFDPIFWFHHA